MTRKILPQATAQSRRLRRERPDTERILWWHLSRLPCRFRRQHPIGPFTADFVCRAHKVVIECDGTQHEEDDCERDLRRDRYMERRGWRVLRFWNGEVWSDIEMVLDTIEHACFVD